MPCSWRWIEVAKFRYASNKAFSKRLFSYMAATPSLPLEAQPSDATWQIYRLLSISASFHHENLRMGLLLADYETGNSRFLSRILCVVIMIVFVAKIKIYRSRSKRFSSARLVAQNVLEVKNKIRKLVVKIRIMLGTLREVNIKFDKFPFSPKKMSVSGALFDIAKLTDVSKNVISTMDKNKVFSLSYEWAKEFNPQLASLYEKDKDYATAVLNIDRENKKPRKDIAKWSDIPDYISYMYNETFVPCYDLTGNATPELAVKVLELYKDKVDLNDDKDAWFNKIKEICEPVGCTPNVKEFKQNPDAFKGHVGDVSTIIRVALTGRVNTPDLFSITALLGRDEVISRIDKAITHYKEEI